MAATTLKAIMDRFQTVLEASPLFLTATKDPFSHDRAPNLVVDTAYRIEDSGLVSSRPVGASQFVRVDRLTVFLARKQNFAAVTAMETLEQTLNTIERYVLADDASNNYHASLGGRRITRIPDSDVLVASVEFLVDYDYSGSV